MRPIVPAACQALALVQQRCAVPVRRSFSTRLQRFAAWRQGASGLVFSFVFSPQGLA
jgi:hypothetical protein